MPLWITYGFAREDYIIVGANAVSLALVLVLLGFKLRERGGSRRQEAAPTGRCR